MFYLFPRVPLWVMLILGFVYSVSISWNINGISHNFIHNPYFRSPLLNRLFSILESITVGFSQIFYECIHMQHHKGNADRPDEHGEAVDWISIYKHGHDGEAEHPLKYTFLSFFREDPKTVGFLDPNLPPHQRSEANVKQNPFAFSNPNRTLINKTND